MSLVQSYLANNGYDYFDNAAEDTLVFFVRDEEAPYAQPKEVEAGEEIEIPFSNSPKEATGSMPEWNDNSNDNGNNGFVSHVAPVNGKQTERQPHHLKN